MGKVISIFKDQSAVSMRKRGLSDLTKTISTGITTRRIQTNTNGTFRRLVNGEQIGKAIRGEFNAIIVAMLPKVGRTFYAGNYDPEAKPTLPDCWSNDGETPEASAPNVQAKSCVKCPNNIDGSGENGKGKACRYQRRVAVMLEGDSSGDVYQFNIPAKSLFGKGVGNVHPFESYVRFLVANEIGVDYVVTNIAYNLDADTMELQFTPVRETTPDEEELVIAAQSDPATQRLLVLTVGGADGAKTASNGKTLQQVRDEDEDEDEDDAPAPVVAPKKRAAKPKAAPVQVAEPESEDDDDVLELTEEEIVEEPVEETPAPVKQRRTRKPKVEPEVVVSQQDDEDDEPVAVVPVKRAAAKKSAPSPTSSKAKPELLAILDKWSEEASADVADDDDDEAE